MKRREFLNFIGSAAATGAWPPIAHAQRQAATSPRLGMILTSVTVGEREWIAGGVQRLAELGWNDGRNLRIDQVWLSDMDLDVVHARAAELVARAPDVIWLSSNPVMAVVQQTTHTIPVVFVQVADPVGSGFVESLAKPGGNITGFTNFEDSMGGKWLDILKELAPQTTRALVLFNQETTAHRAFLRSMEAAAAALNVALTPAAIHDASDIANAITAFADKPNGGLIALPHPLTVNNGPMIAALAALHRLPAVNAFRFFVAAGGLLSYGSDPADLWRRSASYVDRIFHGAKPADLPVEAPTKFQLVINLKTAKALGLAVSPLLLARADEVIE